VDKKPIFNFFFTILVSKSRDVAIFLWGISFVLYTLYFFLEIDYFKIYSLSFFVLGILIALAFPIFSLIYLIINKITKR